jgi:epoxyqueuosine reductase
LNLREITDYLTSLTATDPRNRVRKGLYLYGPPLVGAVEVADPVFDLFAETDVVGSGFRGPKEWLPSARSVVSYFLPFTAEMHALNAPPGVPAREWLFERGRGGLLSRELRDALADMLRAIGYDAVAPSSSPDFRVEEYRSNWPERHLGYAAGLGTFGLNGSLLTEKGCAGRWGSVVTSVILDPTPRLFDGPYDYCLHYRDGSCSACVERCPANALDPRGHNLAACEKYCNYVAREIYGTTYEHCGKCQSAVPCAAGIPSASAR